MFESYAYGNPNQHSDVDLLVFLSFESRAITIPEFAEAVLMSCTHGETREEAIQNGEEVIDMYLEAWRIEERPENTTTHDSISKTPVSVHQ